MTLVQKFLAMLGIKSSTATAAPRVAEPMWEPEYDGMRYAHSEWAVISAKNVEWRGDSRPLQSAGIANPNHVECGKTVMVPAGMRQLTFTGKLTVVSNNPQALDDAVVGGLRIWVDGVSSRIASVACYREPITDNKTTAGELSVSMAVTPGGKATLYLRAYSPASGLILFDALDYTFSP